MLSPWGLIFSICYPLCSKRVPCVFWVFWLLKDMGFNTHCGSWLSNCFSRVLGLFLFCFFQTLVDRPAAVGWGQMSVEVTWLSPSGSGALISTRPGYLSEDHGSSLNRGAPLAMLCHRVGVESQGHSLVQLQREQSDNDAMRPACRQLCGMGEWCCPGLRCW